MKGFILFCLFVIIFTQKGGGRSFGSIGFSRSFGGSRSYFVSGSRMSFITSCIMQCNIKFSNNAAALTLCHNKCHAQNKNHILYAFGIIVFGLCCCGLCTTVCLNSVQGKNSKQHNRQQFIEKTKARIHKTSSNIMSLEQFQKQKQFFQKQKWKIFYFHLNNQYQNDQVNFFLKYEEPFIYSFSVSGTDNIGKWTGNGYFLCSLNGIKIWMLKDYLDKQASLQIGSWNLLMYEGQQVNQRKYEGKWYYVGHEQYSDQVGQWSMIGSQQIKPQNPYYLQL